MQIVHQQRIAFAELLAKARQLVQPHRLHEAIGEVLAGQIENAPVGMSAAQAGVDALQQMRLAGADRTVQHNRVGSLAGFLDDAQARRHGPRGCTPQRRNRSTDASDARRAAVHPSRDREGAVFSPLPYGRGSGEASSPLPYGRGSAEVVLGSLTVAALPGTSSCSRRAAWNSSGSMTKRTCMARPKTSCAAARPPGRSSSPPIRRNGDWARRSSADRRPSGSGFGLQTRVCSGVRQCAGRSLVPAPVSSCVHGQSRASPCAQSVCEGGSFSAGKREKARGQDGYLFR